MKIPNVNPIWHDQNHRSDLGIHHPTFREIYETINQRDDFNEPQLFYLSRLVDRKLKSFDPQLNAIDLEIKPYRTTSK